MERILSKQKHCFPRYKVLEQTTNQLVCKCVEDKSDKRQPELFKIQW